MTGHRNRRRRRIRLAGLLGRIFARGLSRQAGQGRIVPLDPQEQDLLDQLRQQRQRRTGGQGEPS